MLWASSGRAGQPGLRGWDGEERAGSGTGSLDDVSQAHGCASLCINGLGKDIFNSG